MSERSELQKVLELAAGVEGWMTDDQGARLYAAAARCPAGGQIVEIGSFRGRSTIVLASAAGEDVGVVAIDPHAGNDRGPQEITGYAAEAAGDRAAFEANLRRAGARVRHVAAFSNAAHGAVEGPIDVLYIDGAHRFGSARADWPFYELSIVPMLTALLRYALVLEQGRGAAPEEVFASDRVLQLLGVCWILVFGLAVYVQ